MLTSEPYSLLQGSEEENYLLTPLHELLSNISSAKSHVFMDTNDAMQWAVSGLKENDEYYSYPGSLTTEPYSENVVFILLPKPITLCKKQVESSLILYIKQYMFLIICTYKFILFSAF